MTTNDTLTALGSFGPQSSLSNEEKAVVVDKHDTFTRYEAWLDGTVRLRTSASAPTSTPTSFFRLVSPY